MKNEFDKAKLSEEIDTIKKVYIKKAEEIYNKGDDKIMYKIGKKMKKKWKRIEKRIRRFFKK